MPDGGFISVMSDLTELKAVQERFKDFAEATSRTGSGSRTPSCASPTVSPGV